MKKFLSTSAAALVIAATITSCQKEEIANPATAAPAPDRVPTVYEVIAQHMMEKNMGNGAIFMTPEDGGQSFGALKDIVIDMETFTIISGEIASFGAGYGQGDFLRHNPDGTVTVKIASNSADASYFNFGTQEEYLGTGHLNLRFNGIEEVIEVPFPPFQITLLMLDPTSNALVVNGHADVTLNGEPGETHDLTMNWLSNPGGQGGVDLSFE